jgi:CHAD domain-containing protein
MNMELDFVKLKDIKPALSGYIRDAHGLMKIAEIPDDEAVHDIRVLMKKARAVMHLVASQVDGETFTRNYGAFRDTGRLMCTLRDTSVHRKTLKDLRKAHPVLFNLLKDNEKLNLILKKEEPSGEVTLNKKENIEKINELLDKAGYRIRFQKMDNLDPKLLIMALDGSYNTVIDRYLKSRNSQKPSDIHEFRKRAKDFLYQLYFFRPLNPGSVKGLEKKLDAMTQNLGKYNDLSQLILRLGYKFKDPGNIPALNELVVLIRGEQDRYLSKVWPIAYKIFCPGQKLVNMLGFKILVI